MNRLVVAMAFSGLLAGFALAGEVPCITGADCEITGTGTEQSLTVKSGDGELVASVPEEVQDIYIWEAASLKICVDNPFPRRPIIHLDGVLDLNGHSADALRVENNDVEADRNFTARLVNTSTTGVTLSLSSTIQAYFYGSVRELPGKISIETKNSPLVFMGPDGSSAVSSITGTGSSMLAPMSESKKFKFVFQPPAAAETYRVCLAEIGLTSRGVCLAGAKVSASGDNYENLIDNRAATDWLAGAKGEQTVTISFDAVVPVDGYRITPSTTNGGANSPTGWDVYAYHEFTGWVLMDSQRDVTWSKRQGSSLTNILFSAESRLGSPFGPETAVNLNSKRNPSLRVSTAHPLKAGAVSGSGPIRIESGSALEAADLRDYAGSFGTYQCGSMERQGRIRLLASVSDEQPVSITNAQNLAVVNGGETPVSVLLDDSRPGERLFGRLADGEKGTLGLVKRGSGERILETEDASYTGATRVEAGKLTVARRRAARAVTASKFRFTPLAVLGNDENSYPWAADELQLLNADGQVVPWPSGTTAAKPEGTDKEHSTSKIGRFVDNNISTRMLMPKFNEATTGYASITITASAPMTFCGYQWYSSRDNSADKNRTPTAWRLEFYDDDRAEWVVFDEGSQAWSAEEDALAWKSGNDGVVRKDSSASCAAESGLYTLDETFLQAGDARATHGTIKARYFRFVVRETADPESTETPYSYGWSLAEIGLMKDGARVNWPENVAVSCFGGSVNGNNNSKVSNLCNNIVWEKDLCTNLKTREICFVQEFPSYVKIDAGKEMEFDAYSLVSTGTSVDLRCRLPKSWSFQVSADGETWCSLDEVGAYVPGVDYTITEVYQEMGPFAVAAKYPLLDRGAGDSLGDRSPVSIAAGATLRLATDYEMFGPLSGAGALAFDYGACGAINTTSAGATFAGCATGAGTLVLAGDGVQTFDDADLSGVSTLEFAGGAFGGTARFGALRIVGAVKLTLPANVCEAGGTVPLFTCTSLDANSRSALAAATVVGGLPVHNTLKVVVSEVDGRLAVKARVVLPGFGIFIR
mgnify:CR=1 FL=1